MAKRRALSPRRRRPEPADRGEALLGSRSMAGDTISFARGAPSADILPHEAVREAAERALASDWEKALSYGTGIGHPGLCQWIAERHGDLDPAQVMVANGSLEAGAMLFQHLLAPGDRVIVEQPTYDRTLLLLQQLGVELVPVPLEADGARPRRLRGGAGGGAGEARPHHPQRPQPGRLHALGRRSGRAWSSWPPSTASGSSRTIPTASCPSRASRWRRCSRSTAPTASSTPPPSRRRSAPVSGSATWPVPPRRSPSSPSAPTRSTSRRTCWPSRSSSSSAAPASWTATSPS